MSEYTKMNEWDRKELLSTIGSIAHKSDEFLAKLKELVEEYKNESNDKIGLDNIDKN